MKQIPNLITLANLFLGILAIIFCLEGTLVPVEDDAQLAGYRIELLPERLYLASLFIALAALADFLDGWAARLLGVSGDMGKQLDSLADVVSFGVAPSLILYQFLKLAVAGEEDGLTAGFIWYLPAFLPALAAAWRLARFNIDTGTPAHYFRGTPVPSIGITIAAFPLIWWKMTQTWELQLLTNKWFWYAIAILVSMCMVSNLPVMSNKPKGAGMARFYPHISVGLAALAAAVFLGWWAVPVTFAAFILFSVIFKKQIVQ